MTTGDGSVRLELQALRDALTQHHEWHLASKQVDYSGFASAEQYAKCILHDETVAALNYSRDAVESTRLAADRLARGMGGDEVDVEARARELLAAAYEQMGDRGNHAIAADIRSGVDSGYSARIALRAVVAALRAPPSDDLRCVIEEIDVVAAVLHNGTESAALQQIKELTKSVLEDRAPPSDERAPAFTDAQIKAGIKQMCKVLEDGGYSFDAAFTSAVEAMGGSVVDDPAAERGAVDRCDLATAIAECFMCQPKEMPWEQRTDELAGAVIAYLGGTVDREALRNRISDICGQSLFYSTRWDKADAILALLSGAPKE